MTALNRRPRSGWNRFVKEVCLAGSLVWLGFAAQASAAEFELNALIEAAKGEKPITVYASTGKIKKAAAAFTKKYGIKATGSKIKGGAQIEKIIREHQSGNIIGDVLISADAAAALAQLIPGGMV